MKRLAVLAGLVLCGSFVVAAQQSQSQSPPEQKPAQPAQTQSKFPPPKPGAWQQVTPMAEEKRVQVDDIDKLLEDGKVFFLDVREPEELQQLGTREGYYNIPVGELENRLNELPKDKAILTA